MMVDKYTIKSGKRLRYGYTTGSCAAAAAKAACQMLFSREKVKSISIDTPKGWILDLDIDDIIINEDYASCSVKKDAGDDPDITDGIKIFASARKERSSGVSIEAGLGIGIVTRKGLSVEIGKPAINPVPMAMIIAEVKKVISPHQGVVIEISVPEGARLAGKTFNPKLGIENGISIIGTTGIVEPKSSEALKESIALELSVAKEQGIKDLVFVPGNYGENFALNEYKIPGDRIISISNYIGFMLEQAVYYEMRNILFIGHLGKLIKVAGGIFNTHSRQSDARLEILASNYGYQSGDIEAVKKIMESNTTEEAIEYISNNSFFNYIADRISRRCIDYVHNELHVETVVFSQHRGLLGVSKDAGHLIEKFRKEHE